MDIDWIQGNKFEKIADFSYAPGIRHRDDYYCLVNTFDIEKTGDGNIIFTYPFYVAQLFNVIRHLDKRFIIVTHNGDNRIDPNDVIYLNGLGTIIKKESYFLPENVIKWHAINLNVFNSRIEGIPNGLENDMWFPDVDKKGKMLKKLNEERNYRNLLYMDHTIKYNQVERTKIYDLLENRPWVTSFRDKGLDFDRYIDNIYNHKFAVCPPGNGVGTHRPWEALYMGIIPVERRNLNNRFYTQLPICFVDEWEEITEDFLNKEYERICNTIWNREMLTFEYWKNKIRNTEWTL
jgi:hypothetical protein